MAVTIFGYNSASAGGVLNMPAFLKQFPSIDVADAPENQVHHKSTIQGTWELASFARKEIVADHLTVEQGQE